MLTPAARHKMKQQAKAAHKGGIQANAYETMLIKLASDKRRLKQVQSNERKADVKRELLPDYDAWVTGVIESNAAAQDDVIMTVMLWSFDAGELDRALAIATYALTHNFVMPEPHKRQTACLVAEESALSQFRNIKNNVPVNLPFLLQILELVDSHDMPDQVRAQLHKIVGIGHKQNNQLVQALNHLQRAQALDDNAGCKEEIKRVTKEIKALSA